MDAETAFNMSSDPDLDLELDSNAGVSGEAFFHNDTFIGDLELALQPGGPTWGMRDSERARIRRTLKSILSVAIKDPDNPAGPPLGTLQVDSDLKMEEVGFDQPQQRAVAERFADVIALLLKAGR